MMNAKLRLLLVAAFLSCRFSLVLSAGEDSIGVKMMTLWNAVTKREKEVPPRNEKDREQWYSKIGANVLNSDQCTQDLKQALEKKCPCDEKFKILLPEDVGRCVAGLNALGIQVEHFDSFPDDIRSVVYALVAKASVRKADDSKQVLEEMRTWGEQANIIKGLKNLPETMNPTKVRKNVEEALGEYLELTGLRNISERVCGSDLTHMCLLEGDKTKKDYQVNRLSLFGLLLTMTKKQSASCKLKGDGTASGGQLPPHQEESWAMDDIFQDPSLFLGEKVRRAVAVGISEQCSQLEPREAYDYIKDDDFDSVLRACGSESTDEESTAQIKKDIYEFVGHKVLEPFKTFYPKDHYRAIYCMWSLDPLPDKETYRKNQDKVALWALTPTPPPPPPHFNPSDFKYGEAFIELPPVHYQHFPILPPILITVAAKAAVKYAGNSLLPEHKAKLQTAVDELLAKRTYFSNYLNELVSSIEKFYTEYNKYTGSTSSISIKELKTAIQKALSGYLELVGLCVTFTEFCAREEMELEECILGDMSTTLKKIEAKYYINRRFTNLLEESFIDERIGEIVRLVAVAAVQRFCKKLKYSLVYNTIMENEVKAEKMKVILSKCGRQLFNFPIIRRLIKGAKNRENVLENAIGLYVVTVVRGEGVLGWKVVNAVTRICFDKYVEAPNTKLNFKGLGKCILETPRSEFNEFKVDASGDVLPHVTQGNDKQTVRVTLNSHSLTFVGA
eukprot:GHVU01115480.1.p1 GENE.GHVU01115480.1~~GHVU01115480.1.p1  ORF type:complete len:730 (+),score=86.46 GHVU01115480.1:167-2356(+)